MVVYTKVITVLNPWETTVASLCSCQLSNPTCGFALPFISKELKSLLGEAVLDDLIYGYGDNLGIDPSHLI